MRKHKKKLKDVLVDVICDVCGKSCTPPNPPSDACWAEFAVLEANWGYMSKKDGDKFSCDICENCFEKIAYFIAHLKKESQH